MPGLRETGLVGAAVAITGGVAYVIWNLVSTNKKQDQVNREIRKEPSKQTPVVPEPKPSSKQVLVLGLDGAGKTSLLHCLATGSLEQDVSPTQGFNAVSINKEDVQVEFLEIGGTENLRTYWKKYLCNAQVLVFVVDSSDGARFPLAKKHLHELVAEDPHLSLVVLANKQDAEGACSITDLHEALCLTEVGEDRKLFLISTHVKKGSSEIPSSVQDAWDLILQLMSDSG